MYSKKSEEGITMSQDRAGKAHEKTWIVIPMLGKTKLIKTKPKKP